MDINCVRGVDTMDINCPECSYCGLWHEYERIEENIICTEGAWSKF